MPTSPPNQGGIGTAPTPGKMDTINRQRSERSGRDINTGHGQSGLFSLFSTASSGSSSASSWDLHSQSAPLTKPQAQSQPGVLQQQQQRYHSNNQKQARPGLPGYLAGGQAEYNGLRHSPSQPSFGSTQELSRLPSSNSVPTGMAGDKMLFSPLNRQYRKSQHRSNLSIESTPEPADPPPTSFPHQRRRVHSAPRYLNHHAAQTMCHLLVFPKPSLAAHQITPPASPDDSPAGVVEQGRWREKERDDMAVRARSRSISRGARHRRLSFGEEKPNKSAPLVGSAVVRREEAEKRERRRSRSLDRRERMHSLSKGFGLGHSRSTDNLSQRSHRGANCGHSRNKSAIDLGGGSDLSVARDVSSSTGQRTHHHTRSSPDLLSNPRVRSQPLRVRMRAPDDIVVIGPESPPRIDFSKPLPLLPHERTPNPDAFPMPPHMHDIGVALTSDRPSLSPVYPAESMASQSVSRHSAMKTSSHAPSTAAARAELDRQHRRDKTRRAFAAPAGPSRTSTITRSHYPSTNDTPSSSNPLLSSSTRTQTTDSSDMHSSDLTFPSALPPNRRLTALEQAIGRRRAASLGSSDSSHQHSPGKSAKLAASQISSGSDKSKATITPTRPRRPDSPVGMVPAPLSPTFGLAAPLVHPISPTLGYEDNVRADMARVQIDNDTPSTLRPTMQHLDTNATLISGRTIYTDASEGLDRSLRPSMQHLDTNATATSGRTVYTDASEGWSRDDAHTPPAAAQAVAIPSIETAPQLHVSRSGSASTHTDDDFRGLFFRTPKDAAYDSSPLTASPMPPASHSSPAAFPRMSEDSVGLGYDIRPMSKSAPTRMSQRFSASAKSADDSIGEAESSEMARRLSYGEGTDSDSGIVITPHSQMEADEGERISFTGAQLRSEHH